MLENIKDLKKKEKWLVALYETTRDVNSTLSLKKCLETITDKVTQLLGVERTSLMLLDKESKELKIEHAIGLSEEIIKTTRIRIGKDVNVSGWVAEKGKPLLIEDIEKDGRFPKWSAYHKYYTKSLLSVPLRAKRKIIGVLNVNNKAQGETFTKDDLELLSAFADEAAIAIENSRLVGELIKVNKELEAVNKLRSEFITNLSHMLRTPLVTTKYFTCILKDELKSELSGQQREYLLAVEDNIDRLSHLVDNLLDLAKIESGKAILNRELLSIVSLAKKMVVPLRIRALDKNITIRTLFPSRFPKTYIDEERMNDVFNILLDNTLKFTLPGGKITIQVSKRKEFAEVSVRDTGIGIAKRDLDKLFVKFSQLKPAIQGDLKGSGLGLAISREIISMHKGRIWAKSELGKGSIFTFTLPLYKPLEFFKEQLGEGIREAEEKKSSFSLIILGMESFDRIKKRFGNKQSLKLLKDLERIVKETARQTEDRVMMLRNNCLAILCKAGKPGGNVLGNRLQKALERHRFPTPKGAIKLTIYFDVLTYPEDGLNEEEVIRKARSLIKGR